MTHFRLIYLCLAIVLGLLVFQPAGDAVGTPAPSTRDLAVLAFVDLNGDGAYGLTPSGMEPTLTGIEIGLYLDQPPLHRFGLEDTLLTSGRTNAEGYVIFRAIPTGNYILKSTLAEGCLPTTPLEQDVFIDGNSQGTILEYLFGQLQRSAFGQRSFYPLVRTP